VTELQPSPHPLPEPRSGLRRGVLIVSGSVCVVLATLGLFLPLLPTTPFLLLAAACFARSSPRFLAWLLGNRWFGQYLRDYREQRGISLAQKVITLALLWIAIAYAGWGIATAPWLRVLLVAIATGVSIHVLRLKTLHSPAQRRGPAP